MEGIPSNLQGATPGLNPSQSAPKKNTFLSMGGDMFNYLMGNKDTSNNLVVGNEVRRPKQVTSEVNNVIDLAKFRDAKKLAEKELPDQPLLESQQALMVANGAPALPEAIANNRSLELVGDTQQVLALNMHQDAANDGNATTGLDFERTQPMRFPDDTEPIRDHVESNDNLQLDFNTGQNSRIPGPTPTADNAPEALSADPMTRKLELAEEFRQIGDVEGARDLLEEVVAKGNQSQSAEAQARLDKLNQPQEAATPAAPPTAVIGGEQRIAITPTVQTQGKMDSALADVPGDEGSPTPMSTDYVAPQGIKEKIEDDIDKAETRYYEVGNRKPKADKAEIIAILEDLIAGYRALYENNTNNDIDSPDLLKYIKIKEKELEELNKPWFSRGRSTFLTKAGIIGKSVINKARELAEDEGERYIHMFGKSEKYAKEVEKSGSDINNRRLDRDNSIAALQYRQLKGLEKLKELGIIHTKWIGSESANLTDKYSRLPRTVRAAAVLGLAIPTLGLSKLVTTPLQTWASGRSSYKREIEKGSSTQKAMISAVGWGAVFGVLTFGASHLIGNLLSGNEQHLQTPPRPTAANVDASSNTNSLTAAPRASDAYDNSKLDAALNRRLSDLPPLKPDDVYPNQAQQVASNPADATAPPSTKSAPAADTAASTTQQATNTATPSSASSANGAEASQQAAHSQAAQASSAATPATSATGNVNAPAATAPTIDWEHFPIHDGDNLETLMKTKLDVLSGLTPFQQENVIYNFFKTRTGEEWMRTNGITNIDRIFTNKTLKLQSLNDAINSIKLNGESLVEHAKLLPEPIKN